MPWQARMALTFSSGVAKEKKSWIRDQVFIGTENILENRNKMLCIVQDQRRNLTRTVKVSLGTSQQGLLDPLPSRRRIKPSPTRTLPRQKSASSHLCDCPHPFSPAHSLLTTDFRLEKPRCVSNFLPPSSSAPWSGLAVALRQPWIAPRLPTLQG